MKMKFSSDSKGPMNERISTSNTVKRYVSPLDTNNETTEGGNDTLS